MATITGVAGDRLLAERRFYSRMALFLIALVFLGFAPSFYLRGVVPSYPRPNPTLPLSVLLHGGLFTLWMLLVVAQTQLVAAGRRDVHMKLGALTVLVALALIPIMYLTTAWQVARANQPRRSLDLDHRSARDWRHLSSHSHLAGLGAPPQRPMAQTADAFRGDSHGRRAGDRPAAAGAADARGFHCPADPRPGAVRPALHPGSAHPGPRSSRDLARLRHGRTIGAHPFAVFWTGADWASVAARLPGV